MRSTYTIVSATDAAETDLVTLADVKVELAITGTSEDANLTLQIERISRAFAEYSNRDFALLNLVETFVLDVWEYRQPLPLRQYPIVSVASVTIGGSATTDYVIDSETGFLWLNDSHWSGTVVVDYTGGYDLPDDAPGLLAWAVIEAIRYRRVFGAQDPSIRQLTTTHGDTTVSTGFYSEPQAAFAGFPGSVIDTLRTFRRPALA